MLHRFSSRLKPLDKVFLNAKLKHAKKYNRIAGYFRSSIFELLDEDLSHIEKIQVVCNSDLDPSDIAISKAVRDASLKQRWNDVPIQLEALLYRERYQKLHDLLTRGNLEVRVVPRNLVFVHGKAGVIESYNGEKTCFLGSINETKSAFSTNYEILWEDTSIEGIQWVENEFEALWHDAYPLPDAILDEVERVSRRIQISFTEATKDELPGATLAESPIYRGGEQLQPWQRSFVTMFLEHREIYGKARLLLADDVGLGKTLSLAAGAMMSALLDDGPVLIICPSTLALQWQVELKDRLGIPSAVWLSSSKVWQDAEGHLIKTRGPIDVGRAPNKIAIVSSGLIFHNSEEREVLLGRRYGTVILDEAHKARRRGTIGQGKGERNNLLEFMVRIGERTKNLLLGTATPIQTQVQDLWDLLEILSSGVDFVLGDSLSPWRSNEGVVSIIKGHQIPASVREAWELVRNPLPPSDEDHLIARVRLGLGINDSTFICKQSFSNLGDIEQEQIGQTLDGKFFSVQNPIVRHTILRRRDFLEDRGLLTRIAVNIHPLRNASNSFYSGHRFSGLGLLTNHPFNLAYKAANDFTTALKRRTKAAGFMKSLLLQRICSSFASGKITAEKLSRKELLEDEEDSVEIVRCLSYVTPEEIVYLQRIIDELSRPEAVDPKLAAVKYFLTEFQSEGKTWLEHGCIVFSQYYDTAYWMASELAKSLTDEPVAVYAGLGKSGLFRGTEFSSVEREQIKTAVKERRIRLVVATDAACEGLNLQTLGTLINIDLPWNPSRLEQRLGRIKRFGQIRSSVDMLNLVYHETQDEKIYEVLSKRFKDKFDIFGGLPDTIEDDWIEDQGQLEEKLDQYLHLRREAKNAFELKYENTVEPDQNRWELCARVLSRKDIIDKLSESW